MLPKTVDNYIVVSKIGPKGDTKHAVIKLVFSPHNTKEGSGCIRGLRCFSQLFEPMHMHHRAILYGNTTREPRMFTSRAEQGMSPWGAVTDHLYESVFLVNGEPAVETCIASGIMQDYIFIYTKAGDAYTYINKKTISAVINTKLMKAGGKLLNQTIISIPTKKIPDGIFDGLGVCCITVDVAYACVSEAYYDCEATTVHPFLRKKSRLCATRNTMFFRGITENIFSFSYLDTLGLNKKRLPLIEDLAKISDLRDCSTDPFSKTAIYMDMLGGLIKPKENTVAVIVKAEKAVVDLLSKPEFERARLNLFGTSDIAVFDKGVTITVRKTEMNRCIREVKKVLGGSGCFVNEAIVCVASGSTVDKYMKFGVEFETGAGDIPKCTGGLLQNDHYDGGGVEVNTPIMTNPNVYSFFATYDSFLKLLRNSSTFRGTVTGSSTHIHFSFGQGSKNPPVKGIAGSTFKSIVKFYAGLAFFDGFNYGGRRDNGYGKPIRLAVSGNKYMPRCYDYVINTIQANNYTYTDVIAAGRESLLRHCGGSRSDGSDFHFEYRGTDHCVSAIFVGLKIELLKGIMRYAAAVQATGATCDWDFLRKLFSCKFSTPNEQAFHGYIIRKAAIDMIEELSDFLPRDIKKALLAWATTVSYFDKDTGTLEWYRRNEYHIIKELNFPKEGMPEKVVFEDTAKGKVVPINKNMKVFSSVNYRPTTPQFCAPGYGYRLKTGQGDSEDKGAPAIRVGKSKRILSYIDILV